MDNKKDITAKDILLFHEAMERQEQRQANAQNELIKILRSILDLLGLEDVCLANIFALKDEPIDLSGFTKDDKIQS